MQSKQVRSLMREDRLEEALSQIDLLIHPGHPKDLRNGVPLLWAQMKELNRNWRHQLISESDYDMKKAKLRISILELLTDLEQYLTEEDGAMAYATNPNPSVSNSIHGNRNQLFSEVENVTINNSKRAAIWIILTVTILGTVGVFIFPDELGVIFNPSKWKKSQGIVGTWSTTEDWPAYKFVGAEFGDTGIRLVGDITFHEDSTFASSVAITSVLLGDSLSVFGYSGSWRFQSNSLMLSDIEFYLEPNPTYTEGFMGWIVNPYLKERLSGYVNIPENFRVEEVENFIKNQTIITSYHINNQPVRRTYRKN